MEVKKTLKFITDEVNIIRYIDIEESLANKILREFREGLFDSIVLEYSGTEIKIENIKDIRLKDEIRIKLESKYA